MLIQLIVFLLLVQINFVQTMSDQTVKDLKTMNLNVPETLENLQDGIDLLIKINETVILKYLEKGIFECIIGEKLCEDIEKVFNEAENELRKLY